ncbi:MAG TPA: phage minor head protein [Gemmatimonadaceae bacterium]|nr:phage minor head protein [Gemmatimonadaceae bacterium]
MTPQQARALATLERLARNLAPAMRAAYERALRKLAQSGDIDAAAEALASGDVTGAIEALLPADATAQFAHDLTVAVAQVASDVGPQTAKEIASIVRVDFSFIPGSPSAAQALRALILSRITPVAAAIKDGLIEVLANGLRLGVNPRVTARLARQFIGLTDYDARLLASFSAQIRTDPRAALTRALRDARFDRTLAKAIDGAHISEAQRAAMESAYLRQLQSWRAETWSRTTTLMAIRDTQTAAWNQMADDLKIDKSRLVKTWVATMDDRTRPGHVALHGTTIPIDDFFPNGNFTVGDGLGGDEDFNCRCVQTVRVLPANGTSAADFLRQRAEMFAQQRAQMGRAAKAANAAKSPSRRVA